MTTCLRIIFFGMFQDAIVTPVGYHVFGQTRLMECLRWLAEHLGVCGCIPGIVKAEENHGF
jgi:hypothetical protein